MFLLLVYCHRSGHAEKLSAWFRPVRSHSSFDARILTEYQEVLDRPKFKFEKDKVSALLDHIEHRGLTVAASLLTESLPDIDDEAFLEVAFAAKVNVSSLETWFIFRRNCAKE